MEGQLFLCISRELIKYNLQRFDTTPIDYRVHVINNIVYGRKKRLVARFKDNLVFHDTKEFIKRYVSIYFNMQTI
jgi:hypothetical protein